MSAHDALDAMARRHDSDHWHPQSESCDQRDLVAFARAVLDLADRWEHGATRWADPLPVPPEVEQIRALADERLGTKGDGDA